MNQSKNVVSDPIRYELLAQAMVDKDWNYDILEAKTSIASGTIKNILTGKTTHSSTQNICALCNALDVSIDLVMGYPVKTELELKAVKENDAAFIALKELYDAQRAEMKEINEAHINNIRAHYEQHHEDLKENYEKRLSDKKELNEALKERIKELKLANVVKNCIITFFVVAVVTLLLLEFIHPEYGWIRW